MSKYLYRIIEKPLKTIEKDTFAVTVKHISAKQISNIEIPLPSLEIQEKFIDELESYQKIIDGCHQILKNHKSKIDIDPSWEFIMLKNLIAKNLDSKSFFLYAVAILDQLLGITSPSIN